jgi:hypothetical protein
MKIGAKGVIKFLKPKTVRVSSIKPTDFTEGPKPLFSYIHNLLGSDLVNYKARSRDKGFISKFIMGKKKIYVKSLDFGMIAPSLYDEFEETVGVSDDYLINEISIYKMTNGGQVWLVSIADPYVGPDMETRQLKPKQAIKLQDRLRNMKYFVGTDDKGKQWFVEKTGMGFNQFLATGKSANTERLQRDLEKVLSDYQDQPRDEAPPREDREERRDQEQSRDQESEERPERPAQRRRMEYRPTFRIGAPFTENDYKMILSNKPNALKKALKGADALRGSRRSQPSNKIKRGRLFYTPDVEIGDDKVTSGVIQVFESPEGKFYIEANDLGNDVLHDLADNGNEMVSTLLKRMREI